MDEMEIDVLHYTGAVPVKYQSGKTRNYCPGIELSSIYILRDLPQLRSRRPSNLVLFSYAFGCTFSYYNLK